jgi:superfamily II DNA or RNA helicase
MSLAEPSDVLNRLSPMDRRIAELKALIGEPMNKSTFYEMARSADNPAPDGKAWSPQKIGDSVAVLVRKGVLDPDGTIAPAWCEPLALAVSARPGGKALIARLQGAMQRRGIGYTPAPSWSRSHAVSASDVARALRLMVLAGDTDAAENLLARSERAGADQPSAVSLSALLLRRCPADAGFLDGLPPSLRDRIAAAHVAMLLDFGVLPDGAVAMIETLRQRDWDWASAPALDQALMRLDLMAERPEACRIRMARLRASVPDAVLACEAALRFLEGDTVASLPLFREALKLYRKAVGRRKVALPHEFGSFHVLALVAAADPGLVPEIKLLLDIMTESGTPGADALASLAELSWGSDELAKARVQRFRQPGARAGNTPSPLGCAIAALALAVVDGAKAGDRVREDLAEHERWGAVVPLAARILAEAHARAGSRPQHWRAVLDRLPPGYARRFLEIVPIRASWDRALDRLKSFLVPPDTVKPAAAAAKNRRLIFLFDAAAEQIVPLEQTAKRDGWSGGRPVALQRLFKRDAKLDYLTPEDEKVIGTLKREYSYYDDSLRFDPIRGPLALIGHPRVYDAAAPERRIDLVAYPVELVVQEAGGQIRIDLSHAADEPCIYIDVESPTRWRVVEVTAALVELRGILGSGGLTAPAEARERVIALVKAEQPRLPVRAELAGVETATIAGDPRPVLQIAPESDAFVIRAVVRPLGADGPAYPPGLGARSVLVPSGGAHRRIERDLAAESAALEAVATACPVLASWREADHLWRIETLDEALEALQQLHDVEGKLGLEWPQGAAIRPTRDVDARSVSLNIASGRDWFEVKGELRVDEDLVVDMADLLARMHKTQGRFIALDDGRYLALTEDLRRRLDAFSTVTEGAKGGRRIGAAGAGAIEDLVDAAGTVKSDKRWKALIEQLDGAQRYEPALPAGLNAELRDYQRQGFTWLARLSRLGLGACLADDMGLGKTVQTLALLLNDAAKGPSLVVAPTSVCHNWALEAARFAPGLTVRMLAAAPDRAALVEALGSGDVLVVSYGLLHTEVELLAGRRFAVAVFDEAQNLKNADTRRAQASRRIEADFRLALSGTPVENRLDELWSLFDTVNPGLLGSRESFQRRFAGPIERSQAGGTGAGLARQALKTLLRPYLLRRTKAVVLTELPSRTEITLEIEAGEEERAFYEALRRKALEGLAETAGAGGQKRMRILAEITRLRRAACHPALIEPGLQLEGAKLTALLELVAELRASRHRALVFSQFTSHLDLVEAALRKAGVSLLRLDGSTPAKDRPRLVDAFQRGEGELFLISLKAGGSGLNLTAADYVIHLDPWWNPAVEDQATDRAHRIGQTLPVTVYRLVVKDSIEEKILALHAAKRALSADFLDGAEQAGALDEDELMALIRG